ncbi:hypothetical protein M8J77_001245 [Diaphorina citri]|nr:hypothetical protein M8J77_001245 [Diaphorina citri]
MVNHSSFRSSAGAPTQRRIGLLDCISGINSAIYYFLHYNTSLGDYGGVEYADRLRSASCGSYVVNMKVVPVCRVQFIKEFWVLKKKPSDLPDFIQVVVEGQAYYDGKGGVLYRKATLGGNLILANGTLLT